MKKRLFIIFLLGFSSGLPLALLTSTLQAWFADAHLSVMTTGMLSLIGLPYLYRVFWGPLLDRYSLSSLGKRRSWMLVTQVTLLCGFNLIAWLNPSTDARLMSIIAFLLACCSATQDIAIDAHRTEYLPIKEHALGASIAVFAYRLALLFAGGLSLIIANHYGFAFTYRLIGLCMLVGVVASLWTKEPSKPSLVRPNLVGSFIAPIYDLWLRPGFSSLVLFIIFYKLGEAFTTTTSGIVMPFLIQGLGFSLDTIGYINKLLGISSILVGGLVAGFLLMRCSLYTCLMLFGLIQAATNILFVLLAIVGKNLFLFALAAIFDNFAAGMGSTALVALFMRLVNKQFTATQFSLLVALSSLPRTFSGPIAAALQMCFGWVGLYQIAFILSLAFIPFLYHIKGLIYRIEDKSLETTSVMSVIG